MISKGEIQIKLKDKLFLWFLVVGYRTIWKRHTRITSWRLFLYNNIVTKWHRFRYITATRAMYILFTKSEYSKLAVKIAWIWWRGCLARRFLRLVNICAQQKNVHELVFFAFTESRFTTLSFSTFTAMDELNFIRGSTRAQSITRSSNIIIIYLFLALIMKGNK